jgi:hypothetical protein
MKVIGCDFHPSYQQIAVLDSVTGGGEDTEPLRKVGGAGLLRRAGRAARVGIDPRQLRAEAEASGGRSFSADLGAHSSQRDDRQLLLHRHKLVRKQVKNQLQAPALNQGV